MQPLADCVCVCACVKGEEERSLPQTLLYFCKATVPDSSRKRMFKAGDAPSDSWQCIATRLKADQTTAHLVCKESGVVAHAVDFLN